MDQEVVDRVALAMRERLSEPLGLPDMAATARFSAFHMSRAFRRATGLSPGRFLTAVRLQEAQRLLLTTSLSVGDISALVGYSSLGTFTTRFANHVGVPPGRFRRTVWDGPHHWYSPSCGAPAHTCGSILGTAQLTETVRTCPIFVGVHGEPSPESRPVCGLVLTRPAPWRLDLVPPGQWFVLALAWQLHQGNPIATIANHPPPMVAVCGPIEVPRRGIVNVDLNLFQACPSARPVVIRLPDVPMPR